MKTGISETVTRFFVRQLAKQSRVLRVDHDGDGWLVLVEAREAVPADSSESSLPQLFEVYLDPEGQIIAYARRPSGIGESR